MSRIYNTLPSNQGIIHWMMCSQALWKSCRFRNVTHAFESDVDEALHAYRLGELLNSYRAKLYREQLGERIGVKRAQKWHCGKTSERSPL